MPEPVTLPSAAPVPPRLAHAAPALAEETALVLEGGQLSAPTPLRDFWADFSRNRGAVTGLVMIVGLVLVALFANLVAPHSPIEQFREATLAPPAWQEG